MYKVFVTKLYEIQAKKRLNKKEYETAERIFENILKYRAETFGDRIKYNFFREFRINGKRVYFLIYKDIAIVLVIGVSKKKDQQEVINSIFNRLKDFKNFARSLSKK